MTNTNRCWLKKWQEFHILSDNWDTLSFYRRRASKMKVLLFSLILGLLYAGQGEAQLLLKPVPGVVQAGRMSWGTCACPFWGLVVWILKSSHLPATQNHSIHQLYTCRVWSSNHLYHLLTGRHACSLLL